MLQRQLSLVAALGAVAALAAIGAPVAHGEERTCRQTLGKVTVDNLRVPTNAKCTLAGTYVKGTIKVGRNATLVAKNVRVVGNVQAENAANVIVEGASRIGGSVQLKQGRAASVVGARITGDIQYDSNVAALVARSNKVGGSIQIVGNSGGVAVFGNRVNGNLQCKQNRPAPTGGANLVGGNKEGQCKRF